MPRGLFADGNCVQELRALYSSAGIKINTDPEKCQPIKQMRLIQFDGRTWQPIGNVIESAFSDMPKPNDRKGARPLI